MGKERLRVRASDTRDAGRFPEGPADSERAEDLGSTEVLSPFAFEAGPGGMKRSTDKE